MRDLLFAGNIGLRGTLCSIIQRPFDTCAAFAI